MPEKIENLKMKNIILSSLIIILGTISSPAMWLTNQQGMVYDGNVYRGPVAATNHAQTPKKLKTYTALCPHCRTRFSNLLPSAISTNGGASTNGGIIVQRTITFGCPNRDCLETFTSRNTVFMPESIAVEDEPEGVPSSASTWTTNPNLRLAIEILDKTNVFTLTGVTNNQTISNTVTLGISPMPMAAVRFPTEMGKTYKCQASDDNYTNGDPRKVWFDGLIVPGTGHSITNYEMPVKAVRIYRVVENPTL